MGMFWKNKFLFWNFIALLFIKAFFSYSGLQLASVIDGFSSFSKEEVIFQTNNLRQNLGFNPLKESGLLDVAAAQKLQDMIKNQYFAHTSPAGVSPWHWIDINEYKYIYAGENLAIGFLTAKDTVNAWSNSPSHRANLLNPNYKEIGVAIAPAKIQNSEGFLAVQLFGSPKPTIPLIVHKSPLIIAATPKIIPSPQETVYVLPTIQSAGTETEKPTAVPAGNLSQRLNHTAYIFNAIFILYALIAFLVSLVVVVFRGLKRDLIIRTSASFTVLILTIAIPVLHISRIALII